MILLAGATSSPGRLVAASLSRAGHAVRVLVRGEADARAFAARGVDVVRGDVRDPATVDAEANEALALTARACGVRRFVLLSALFADREDPPVLLSAKRQAERAVVASGLSYAIIRPSTFTAGASSLVGYVGPNHGYACDAAGARELLGREPTSVDAALREYYATTTRTPWSESNFGALRNRTR